MIHSARPQSAQKWRFVNLFDYVHTYRRTENICENSDHYRQWLWVGLVDKKRIEYKYPAEDLGYYNAKKSNKSKDFLTIWLTSNFQLIMCAKSYVNHIMTNSKSYFYLLSWQCCQSNVVKTYSIRLI